MAKTPQYKIDANARYMYKAYDAIQVRARKEEHLNERIKAGAEKAQTSAAAYVLDAIRARLDADGIPPATDTEQTE